MTSRGEDLGRRLGLVTSPWDKDPVIDSWWLYKSETLERSTACLPSVLLCNALFCFGTLSAISLQLDANPSALGLSTVSQNKPLYKKLSSFWQFITVMPKQMNTVSLSRFSARERGTN